MSEFSSFKLEVRKRGSVEGRLIKSWIKPHALIFQILIALYNVKAKITESKTTTVVQAVTISIDKP